MSPDNSAIIKRRNVHRTSAVGTYASPSPSPQQSAATKNMYSKCVLLNNILKFAFMSKKLVFHDIYLQYVLKRNHAYNVTLNWY